MAGTGHVARGETIEGLETCGFPAAGKLTEPRKIHDRGEIVGAVIEPAGGGARGFYRGRDGDSDTGLMYYRARWYDPKVGRFISEDPIGLA